MSTHQHDKYAAGAMDGAVMAVSVVAERRRQAIRLRNQRANEMVSDTEAMRDLAERLVEEVEHLNSVPGAHEAVRNLCYYAELLLARWPDDRQIPAAAGDQ